MVVRPHARPLRRLAFLASLVALAACEGAPREVVASLGTGEQVRLERGAELYAQQCALCHGATGAGDGLIAALLFPRPRDFTTGRFRLVSTTSGGPSDEDLLQVLRRGIPGSVMPSWDWLPPEDLRALATHVRGLAVEGVARRLLDAEPELEPARAHALAEQALAPGPRIPPVPELEPTPRVLSHGRTLYEESCASCHGPRGRGPAQPQIGPLGSFQWARDFTAGILAGGGTHQDLAERILAGIPGTNMMPTPLPAEDAGALVAYVRSLLEPGADSALVQRRTRIRAPRSSNGLPDSPEDPRWSLVPEHEIALAPLVWGGAPPLHVRVAAMHDGSELVLRLIWADDTRDQRIPGVRDDADAAAVALSNAPTPPPFGMGGPGSPVEMWHWRADRAIDVTGVLDLLEASPHVLHEPVYVGERADVSPRYLPAPALSAPSGDVAGARASGPGALQHGQAAGGVHAFARWRDGEWRVVMRRELAPREGNDLVLRPGTWAHLAFALWNGARKGQLSAKSVTMWHEVVLER